MASNGASKQDGRAANPIVDKGGRAKWRRRLLVAGAGALTCAPFLSSLPSAAAGAKPRRISMVAVTPAARVPIGDKALGLVALRTRQSGLVVLRAPDEGALTSFISAVTDKSSSLFHQYLAPGAFAQRFGPSAATVAAVKAQLASEGLQVTGVSRDGLLVSFSGSAGTVDSAFGTSIERYRLANGAIGQATVKAIRLPSSIAGSVAAVVGLDTLSSVRPADMRPGPISVQRTFAAAKAPRFSHPSGSPTACTAALEDAETSGGLTDDEIANAYGAFGLYRMGDIGTGQHIAVFELEPFLPSDIETFDTCYFGATQAAQMSGKNGQLAGSRLSIVPVDGGELQPGPGSQNDEATLDIEDVSAIAPGAKIDVYEAPNSNAGLLDEYSAIVNSDTDQIVTSSWAGCEQLQQVSDPGIQQAENLLFEQAAAQGQTVMSAAGDSGDDECNSSRLLEPPPAQNMLSVLDPGSQPYVLSVGGSTIDSATQPAEEHVWDDGAQWGAGGGGVSESWAMPSWQASVANTASNATAVANAEAFETSTAKSSAPFTTPTFCDATLGLPAGSPCRETPDVSAQADEFTGSVTIYGKSLGYGPANGWATIGGTSSATPIWAAMMALVNASPACSTEKINGVPDVGFVSPILYGIGANPVAYAASFNDIVSGNNDEYGLDNGLVFPAHSGYDMASGLGSPHLTSSTGGNALAFYMCNYAGKLSPPSVTSLSPTSGATKGGFTETVFGTGFGSPGSPDVKSLEVGGTKANSIVVTSPTTLTAVFPPAAATTPTNSPAGDDGAGPEQVVVTLKDGESSVPSAASLFEYVDETSAPLPIATVTGISPFGGLESSPKPVTIYGSGFTSATAVSFGGVAAASFTVKSPYEITVTPPAYSTQTCASLPTTGVYAGENATNDICQVQVVVTNANGSSATSTIEPPFEGALQFDNMFGQIAPPGEELSPQPTEFDYVPAPRITSVSTGTIADLKHCVAPATAACNAGLLASEVGGPANLVTVKGTGMNALTFDYATLGPLNENAVTIPVSDTGTSIELDVPPLPRSAKPPTVEPLATLVGFDSLAGSSNRSEIVYAGVPKTSKVVNASTGEAGVPATEACPSPAPSAGCGTPVRISGAGLSDTFGPIGFVDNFTGFSLGTQYNYAVKSDSTLTTQSVAQNPGVVDVQVCTVTGCSFEPGVDDLFVYPPGNPKIDGMTPTKGAAQGGNEVVIDGSNLGCVVAVAFGQVITFSTTNSQALLTCGTTNQLVVTAPPGKAGTTVPVRVATVESVFAKGGKASNAMSYAYSPSAPSPPRNLTDFAPPGEITAHWAPPASNGGSAVSGYVATATSPGFPSVREVLGASTTKVTFTDLQAGAPWVVNVRAVSKTGLGLTSTTPAVQEALGDDGYLVATQDGGVVGFGDVSSHGGVGGEGTNAAGIAATPQGLGYWVVTTSGAVTSFGNATFYGQANRKNVSGIAALPNGKGYWIVTKNGAVQAFGRAKTYPGKVPSGSDIVAIASSRDGAGYLLVGSDGSVTAFGDAVKHGSLAGKKLAAPIVAVATAPNGRGYWLAGANGRVFSFGDAVFHGSLASKHLSVPVVAIAATPTGDGYWLIVSNGQVYNFGAAQNMGSATSAAAMGI